MKSLIRNCRIISPGLDLPDAHVVFSEGVIEAVSAQPLSASSAQDEFDAGGHLLLPGFIDIHSHGAGGADVCDGTREAIETIAQCKLKEGVTTWLPTTLTLPQEDLAQAARAVAAYRSEARFVKTPALHVEGPFLNPRCLGAQNPAHVRPPDAQEIFALRKIVPIAVVSVAVEMPGGLEFVRTLRAHGITSSLAHTAATYAQFLDAKAAGLTHLTHFGNQMTPLHHREIGIVGAGLLDEDIMVEIICDTVHVAPAMIELVFKTKGTRQMMLITDSMAAAWMGDGQRHLGGLEVNVVRGEARLPSGALAGSTLRYNDGLKNVARLTGRPWSELVATTSWNQARSLGWPGLGKVEAGFAADLVLLNTDFEVQATWVGGERRFQR